MYVYIYIYVIKRFFDGNIIYWIFQQAMFDDTGGCYIFIVTWICMFLLTFSELFHKADLDQQDQEKTLRVPA